MTTRDLLIEIGVEELPSSFLAHALAAMKTAADELFAGSRLAPESIRVMGTPRRMVLVVSGLPEQQPDRSETVTGPPWAAAFEDDGTPKKAAIGFAKKNGVEVDALESVETPKGKYVAAKVFEAGRPAREVLPELLNAVCKRITFPKSMRWGQGDFAFGRPIHWLVALHGDEVIPFEFAGLTAGRTTRGHRFLAPAEFEVANADAYVGALDAAHVVVDTNTRRTRMEEALHAAAKAAGGEMAPDDFLLGECLSLVEAPFVVPGTIEQRFLELPDEVVISVMRDHQRYFAVRSADGELLPTYLNVVNTAEAPETIAKGNDRVLTARLADAEFFVKEDRKRPLADRLPKLDKVTFQKKLGSMGEKVRRIETLARALAEEVGADAERAVNAARLAKADLETLIVFEFPELQGLMGRYYANLEGIDADIADAIAEHYQPAGASDSAPESVLGSIVAAADRADTLVGCFSVGLIPSGSADPFALRRAALGILRIAVEGQVDIDLGALVARAYDAYDGEKVQGMRARDEVLAQVDEFVRGRMRAYYRDRLPGDVVDACLGAWQGGSLRDLDARMKAVDAFRGGDDYAALAVAFKRAYNITKDAPRGAVDASLLEAGAEQALVDAWAKTRADVEDAVGRGAYEEALAQVGRELRDPIDTYFGPDGVFVMHDDERIRTNRLNLLGEIADAVSRIVHFHLLSTPNS